MNRATFLTLYIPIALLFSMGLASSWTVSIMALMLGHKGPIAFLSPVFIVSILSPIFLIVLAHLRGKSIGMPKLVWFPVAALCLTLLPLLSGLLVRSFFEPGNSGAIGSFGYYIPMFIATGSTLGPLILHTICCVLGGKSNVATQNA